MAVSSIKDFWIHPNALTITLNYFGDPQLIQTSMLAGAVIMAYRKDVISYDAAHNYREWKLQAFPTQLNDTCAYYVHAELSRSGDTAMIIYSPAKRDIQGRTLLRVEKDENGRDVEVWDETTSTESFFIYLGTISASVDNDGAKVERAWTDGFYTGTLDTDQQRMEEASGEWKTMFNYNAVTDQIEPLKPFSKIKVMGEAIFQSIAQFVNGLVIGKRKITDVAASSDSGNESKVSDATLPTTGYVQKELDALDDHFLIKDDADTEQSVAGPVTFEKDVTVQGDHAVGKSQTIGGTQTVSGSQTIGGAQEVKGVQTLHQGFKTPNFFQQGDIIQGAQVDADGNAAFTSITAPVMQIYELSYNRKTAVQEEFIFSDGDTIETVTYIQADGTEIDSTAYNGEEYSYIRLGVRKQYEGYMTTFKDEDNLYSNVNIIGDSGQPATTGKCWMRVLALDNDLGVDPISSDGLFINAILYSEAQCPGNVNMAPTPHMVISRHGNANGILHPDRQSVFIISTKAENMVQLRGISSPIIPDTGAYAIVSGKLPSTLLAKVQKAAAYISENDPVSYARYGIFENLIQLDHEGLPIRTERYRGAWSKEVAMSDGPYMVAPTTYDTVTHNGSLWMCQQSGTISEPSDTSTEWIKKVSKGSDASAVIYEIKPSANIVYVKGGSLSTNNLDVTIGRTDSNGYFDIADQAYLDSAGLIVQWAIDGGERHDLNISPDEPIDLEDESGELLAENGNALLLEGETIDISSIKDNITLYLVDTTTGNDMAERIIPVVKDGDSPYTIIATPPNINVLVNANDESIISDVETAVYIYVKKGTSDIEPTLYYVDANEFETNSAKPDIVKLINPIAQSGNKRWRVTIRINKGSYKQSDIPSLIRVKVFDRYATDDENNPLLIGYADVTPSISQRGLVGPAGETGPLLFPAGYLNFGESYSLVMDGDSVAAQPFYYYQTDEQKAEGIEGTYYVLQKNITAAENIESNLGNTDYWRPFTKIKYLFTEALMANWAKLAKFIFYAEFMFSQQGTNISGDEGLDWSSVAERMFLKDEDGNIIGWTGEFIPNTMIDALRGIISCGKFIEQFDYFTSGNIYRIDLNKAHNVYIPYKEADLVPMYYVSQFNSYPNLTDYTAVYDGRMGYYTVPTGTIGNSMQEIWYKYYKSVSPARFVTLPEFSEEMATAITEDLVTGTFHETMWLEDGTHVCIMHELSDHAMNPSQNESGNTDFESPVIVFPDNSILDISNYSTINNSGAYEMGGYSTDVESYFVWRGIRVSAVILAPGTMLKLRSSHVKYNGKNIRLWYVENSSDFDVTAMTLNVGVTNSNVEVSGTTKVDFHLDPIGWRDYGRTVIGSCMMNQTLRETSFSEGTDPNHKNLAYKDTIKTTLYNIYPHALYADENSAMTYTLWFNGVTVADDGSITMNSDGIVQCDVSPTALVNTLDNKAGVSYTGVK